MKTQLNKYRNGRKALKKIERSHGNIDKRLSPREQADLFAKVHSDLFDALGKIVEADAVGDSWVGDNAIECWDVMTNSMMSKIKADVHGTSQVYGKQKALSNLKNALRKSEKQIDSVPKWMVEACEELLSWLKDEIERLNSLNY